MVSLFEALKSLILEHNHSTYCLSLKGPRARTTRRPCSRTVQCSSRAERRVTVQHQTEPSFGISKREHSLHSRTSCPQRVKNIEPFCFTTVMSRSEEHTSELQSH